MWAAFGVGLLVVGGAELMYRRLFSFYWRVGFKWLDRAVAKLAVRAYNAITG